MQHLRSNTASKRPTPASMADGQLAINTNATSPGLFFKDAGGSLIKIGPVHVGTSAPNSSPAGSSGNAIGEQWLDTSGGGYVFKVWDGSAWRSEAGEFVDVTGDTMTGDLTISGADLVMSNGEIIAATGAETTPSITFDGDTNTGLYSPGADQVAVTTGGTGRLFVDGSGNVGIGASSPGYRLDVNSGTTDTIVGRLKSTSTTAAYMTVEASGTTLGSVRFGATGDEMALWSGSGETMRLDSSGNVGIGTSSPDSLLEVRSSGSGAETIAQFGNSVIGDGLQIQTNGNLDWGLNARNSRNLTFSTNQTERLRIDASGNVGIGTTDPGSALHVVGDIRCNGVDLDGPFEQTSEAVSALNVDCSAGNYFTKSISSNSTFTFSNIPASGTAYSFTLEVDVTGTSTAITWPASVKWPSDTAPSLTDTKTHLFMFVTNDGGTTWRGAALVDYTT